MKFHLGADHFVMSFDGGTGIPCGFMKSFHDVARMNPDPVRSGDDGFTVSKADEAGDGWIATFNPNAVLPSDVAHMVAAATTPLGPGISGSFPCV